MWSIIAPPFIHNWPQWFPHDKGTLKRRENREKILAEAPRSGEAVIAAFATLESLAAATPR